MSGIKLVMKFDEKLLWVEMREEGNHQTLLIYDDDEKHPILRKEYNRRIMKLRADVKAVANREMKLR